MFKLVEDDTYFISTLKMYSIFKFAEIDDKIFQVVYVSEYVFNDIYKLVQLPNYEPYTLDVRSNQNTLSSSSETVIINSNLIRMYEFNSLERELKC